MADTEHTDPTTDEPSKDQAPSASEQDASPVGEIQAKALEAQVIEALRQCFDPEIPVNVYDLGLIYEIDVKPAGVIDIKMTLTSPACPVAGTLPPEIGARVKSLDDVSDATVEVVWDPPWTPDRMSEAAKLELNM